MHHYDIFSSVCKFLNDIEKINLTATSKVTDRFKNKLLFTDIIIEKKISNLSFYDNFTNVTMDCRHMRIPKNIKELHMECSSECKCDSLVPNLDTLTITHLTWRQNNKCPRHRCVGPRVVFTECFI